MMRSPSRSPWPAPSVLLTARDPWAQAMIYPNAGQTPAQLDQDRAACEAQAAAQSGYHPSQPAAAPAPTRPGAGQRLAGAARGAAAGAVVEGMTDKSDREIEDPSGAGARAGAVAGGVRQRQDRRAYRREARQRQAAQSQQQAAFSQIFNACMAARGYPSNEAAADELLGPGPRSRERTGGPHFKPIEGALDAAATDDGRGSRP